jgi:hypothetical protein
VQQPIASDAQLTQPNNDDLGPDVARPARVTASESLTSGATTAENESGMAVSRNTGQDHSWHPTDNRTAARSSTASLARNPVVRDGIWPPNRISEQVQHLWCICVGEAEEGGCSETVPATMDVREGQGRHRQTRGEARPSTWAIHDCIAKVPDVAEGAEHRSCAMIAFLRY